MKLKIMTFNVRGAFHDDGDNSWQNRRDLNLATIQKYAPDIIAFQEAQTGNLEAYDRALSHYHSEWGFPAPRDNGAEYLAIYWRDNHCKKLDAGAFYLSETADTPSIGWNASLIRPTTWLRLVVADTELVLFNTHFPHRIEEHETRTHCAKLILSQIQALAANVPVIVTGDFNALPDSPAYKTFLEQGFVDTYRASGQPDTGNTFHNFKGDKFPATGIRIDWLLLKNAKQKFTIDSCEIIRDSDAERYPL